MLGRRNLGDQRGVLHQDPISSTEEASTNDAASTGTSRSSAPRRGVKNPTTTAFDRVPSPIMATGAGPAGYSLRDGNVTAHFSPMGIALSLLEKIRPRERKGHVQGWGLHWGVVDGRQVEPQPTGELATRISVFKGTADKWKVDQKTYNAMTYPGVAPGVDMLVESRTHGLKYSLHAARAADLASLRLRYRGALGIRAVDDGSALEIPTGRGVLIEDGLRCTQHGRAVQARYQVLGPEDYSIVVDDADPEQPLDVDPVIGWSTFLGGTRSSSGAGDVGRAIAVDSSGNVYVSGYTYAADFPIVGGFSSNLNGYQDAFVCKLNPTLSGAAQLVWSTYLGGSNYEYVAGIAIDGSGNVYVAGDTGSPDYPTTVNAYDTVLNNLGSTSGADDAFVTKIKSDGSAILWSTFLGGDNSDWAQAIAVDSSGTSVWVAGNTYSPDFPTLNAFQSAFNRGSLSGNGDGFVAKFNPSAVGAAQLVWSSYLGGGNSESINGMAVDTSGNVFLTGYTYSNDFPTTPGAYSTSFNVSGNADAFVAKVSASGSTLAWSTYIGGSSYDFAYAIALDSSGKPYITGYTSSGFPNYPTTLGTYRTAISGSGADVFVSKFDPSLTGSAQLVWSTFLGGDSDDYGQAIAVDGSGNPVIVGYTYSSGLAPAGFPTTLNAYDRIFSGYEDGFASKLNSTGTALLWSTFLGGSDYEYCNGVALDSSGNVYVTGSTGSSDFPTSAGAYKTALGGYEDAFVTKFNPAASGAAQLVWSTYLGGAFGVGNDEARDVTVDSSGNVYVTGVTYSLDFPLSVGAFDGTLNTPPPQSGSNDVFVTKLNPALSPGSQIVWSTYLGGNNYDESQAVRVDASGNVYVTGSTSSSDFPTTASAYRTTLTGYTNGFVTKLNPAASGAAQLVWSTYIGGTNGDYPTGLAVNPVTGIVAVTGESYSSDFPRVNAYQNFMSGSPDAFVCKFNPALSGAAQLVWSTFLGGSSSEYPRAIKLDSSTGVVYVGGITYSFNFPISIGAYQNSLRGSSDLFVSKLDPSQAPASQLLYSTFFGGSNYESLEDLAVDSNGAVYLTGNTSSFDFPTSPGAFHPAMLGFSDGYVTKIDPNAPAPSSNQLIWSTYLGGTSDDYCQSLGVDGSGNVYVTGFTYSDNFPLKNAFQNTYRGNGEAFITKINSTGTGINWSSYLGGTDYDTATSLALGPNGSIFVAGYTNSSNFPLQNANDSIRNGEDAFVTRIDNSDPNTPIIVGQFKLDGSTPLAVGAWTSQNDGSNNNLIVRATTSDPDEDTVKLQVEVKAIDVAFNGVVTTESLFNPSGTTVSLLVSLPTGGSPQYHWRCRSVDSNLRASAWVSFGGNSDGAPPGTPAARDVGLDRVAPTVSITVPTSSTSYKTNTSPILISGTSSDATSGVSTVTWSNTGTGGGGTATGTTSWSISSVALAPFPTNNHVTVTSTDAAGNQAVAFIDITYDTVLPNITFTTPVSNLTNLASISIGGTATDNDQVASVTWTNSRGGNGTATLTGSNWTANVGLQPGDNNITVTATDGAGNIKSTSRIITYDNVLPTVSITNPPPPSYTINATSIVISGTASDANGIASVTFSAPTGSGSASGTTSWSTPAINLNAGANLITITAQDVPGNTNFATITINRDTAAPAVSFTTPVAVPFGGSGTYTTGTGTLAISGAATDDISVSSVTWVNSRGGSGTASLSGPPNSRTWSATLSLLPSPPDNVITVTATDAVGRTGTATLTVTYNTTAPAVIIDTPATTPFVAAATPFTISGTASAALGNLATINVKNNATNVTLAATAGPTLPTPSTSWSASVNLVIGSNPIDVTVTDDSSNSTTASVTVILDPFVPAVTITGPTGADTYFTGSSTVALSGVASDNRGVTQVTWSNAAFTPALTGTATLGGTPTSATWNVASIPLHAGLNSITVTAFDAAGNTATDSLDVTFDATLPTLAIDTPTSSPTFTTTQATIDVGGTASDNEAVTSITWTNSGTGGAGTASGTSPWSAAGVPLALGANVIRVDAGDAAGNTRSATITIYRDGAPPTVALTSPTSNGTFSTTSSTLAIGGTASDDLTVANVTWTNVGAINTTGGTALGTNFWSVPTITLDAGDNTITVTATDGAGQTAVATLVVNYDPNAPTLSITTPGANPFSTTSTPLAVSGTASDNVGVTEVTWLNTATGGVGTASGTTSWTFNCPLTSGSNLIQVTAKDQAGNTMTTSTTVIYDPAAPVVTITAPTTGISLSTGVTPIVIGGIATDDVGVASVTWTSDRGPGGTATGTDTWNFSVGLLPGNNVISVTASDAVGRTGTSRLTVVFDPTPPQVLIQVPTGQPTYNTTLASLNLSGIATDNLNVQTVTWSNAATGASGTTTGVSSWSVSSIALNQGANAITISATDGVGNVGTATLTVTRDSIPPAITISSPVAIPPPQVSPYATSTRPLLITGTATDNLQVASVSWVSDRGPSGSATLALPNWSASVYLYPGINNITFTAADGLGNQAFATLSVDFSPESVAPTTLITTPNSSGFATAIATPIAIAGTADDNIGVVSVTWQNQTTKVRGTATMTGSNPVNWTASVPLKSGRNVIVVTSTDDAGNTGTDTIEVDFTPPADTADPTVQIVGPTNTGSYVSTLSPQPITISATDDVGIASVTWFNDATGGDGVATPGAAPNWTAPIPLTPGPNIITVTAYDAVGNTATDVIIITFNPPPGDTTPPVVTITSPSTTTTTTVSTGTVDLTGTATDNGTLTTVIWSNAANGMSGTADTLSPWSATAVLTAGLNVITMTAYDAAGNRGTDRVFVSYVPPPPPPEHLPAGHCGAVGLEILIVGLFGAARRMRARGR